MDGTSGGLGFMLVPLIGMMSSRPLLAALIGAIMWLANNHARIQPYIEQAARFVGLSHKWSRSRELLLEGRVSMARNSVFCHMTDEMKGVLYFAHENLDNMGMVDAVEAVDVSSSERVTLNVPIQGGAIDLGNGVSMRIRKIKEETKTDKCYGTPVDVTVIQMLLSSETLAYRDIARFLDECASQYKARVTCKQGAHMIFEYRCNDDDDQPCFDSTPFSSSKTFDNLFFEGKQDIVRRVVEFESPEGRARSDRLGMQHALGMLFHGKPGTAKTSAIKAIANLTKRHVIIVRMDRIFRQSPDRCVDVLRSIMHSPKIGDISVPQRRRLWVFEETDCWQSILEERDGPAAPPSCRKNKARGGDEDDATASAILEILKTTQAPTTRTTSQLGNLLELLDGLIEMPDRMIIMTTNHPDKLDSALLRPGRIDIMHEFRQLTRADLTDMYRLWYDRPIPEHILREDRRFTQAEAAQLFLGELRPL